MTFLLLFCGLVVALVVYERASRPGDDDDRPTWHKRNHE